MVRLDLPPVPHTYLCHGLPFYITVCFPGPVADVVKIMSEAT